MDNIKTWTGLSMEESIGIAEDRDKWRKYVECVATLGLGMEEEQNKTSDAQDCVDEDVSNCDLVPRCDKLKLHGTVYRVAPS